MKRQQTSHFYTATLVNDITNECGSYGRHDKPLLLAVVRVAGV